MMFGQHGFMGGYMWLFWIVLIVGLVFLVKWIVQQNRPGDLKPEEDSLEILRKRYAKGEMGKQEFEQKKKDLLS